MTGRRLVAVVSGWMLLGAVPVAAQAAEAGAGNGPTDPQIAAIVVAANQADIDAAKLAEARSQNRDVKEFAKTMVRDHEAVNAKAKALVKKLNVTPEPSPTSAKLEEGSKENLASLRKLRGAAFDKAYADHEVAYHQQVLDAINSTLIPNAKTPQLKALLEKVTPAFQAHLDHAKHLQSEVG